MEMITMNCKKRLAGKILGVSPKKVRFAPAALSDIAKAITRSDMRGLIAVGKVSAATIPQHSRFRARQIRVQKRKGRQQGKGSRKGSKYAHLPRKDRWMLGIRVQRAFLQELREKGIVTLTNYRLLYNKAKGGYFRNKRHIKLFLSEHHLAEARPNR